ncbi:MAG: universal stress protein [Dokdonella sp.]|uniref:universal stress protein n=1 Tax=Dokdonella sp. TaxID=2291710 RepID=UPI003F7FE974
MKDILAYADNYTSVTPSMEYAAGMAAALSGHLTAVHVVASPYMMVSPYDAPLLLSRIIDDLRQIKEEACARRSAFESKACLLGARSALWVVAEGEVPEVLSQIGNWHDVLILGRDAESNWGSPQALGGLVLRSHLPCIVTPPSCATARAQCVAIGWNHSPEAIRAIHAALPLLAAAGRIVVLSGKPREQPLKVGWMPEFDLGTYLRGHGLIVEDRELGASDADAGAALLGAAAECRADLLVMGAYGRARFSEWIFGGATRHVLAEAHIPVFLRH